jgi:hypothetical protein
MWSWLQRTAEWTGVVSRLRSAWMHDLQRELKPLRNELRGGVGRDVVRLTGEVDRLRQQLAEVSETLAVVSGRQQRMERQMAQAAAIARLDGKQRELIARLPEVLNETRVSAHTSTAVAQAAVHHTPFPFMVVENVVPGDVYRLLLRSIPPVEFFGDADPIKQNLRIPFDDGPRLATEVWRFVDQAIAHRIIVPAVTARFSDELSQHYEALFGAALAQRAARLPQSPSGGRLMLRRPGYRLLPHRDPKRTMLTCLLYLARPGDDEAYGTQLYRVENERESSYTQTYYPEEEGCRCELAHTVPYRPNSMLVFLNGRGAHGAHIPDDAPAALERFAYQFYVGPGGDELSALIADLPEEKRDLWQNKRLAKAAHPLPSGGRTSAPST